MMSWLCQKFGDTSFGDRLSLTRSIYILDVLHKFRNQICHPIDHQMKRSCKQALYNFGESVAHPNLTLNRQNQNSHTIDKI